MSAVLLFVGASLAPVSRCEATYFSVIHVHQPDPSTPWGSLVLDASGNLYGTAYAGGAANAGVLFTEKTDGTNYTILHTFGGGMSDGANPQATLTLDGSGNLYGTTFAGGPSNLGIVFTMKTDGTGFTLLHTFVGGVSDGANPLASVVLDGSGNIYGTTFHGGSSDGGVAFTMKTDGTGFSLLHTFTGGDGANPASSLTFDGSSSLYGTTSQGGSSNNGVIFTIGTNGMGYTVVHGFAGGTADGAYPLASLILDGSGNLYGTTYNGGASSVGTVFTAKTDGTLFMLLHSFAGGSVDGDQPRAALLLDSSDNLYGTAYFGGPSGGGVLFSLKTNGTGYTIVHPFGNSAGNGQSPYASVILDTMGMLYGTTYSGGPSGVGVVFKVAANGAGFMLLHSFTSIPSNGSYPWAPLILDGSGNLYGTTVVGGTFLKGTIFRMTSDGTSFTILHTFAGGAIDGANPYSSFALDGSGNLYGTTATGGSANKGVVFKMKTDGTGFSILHSFAGGASDGANPYSASVTLDNLGNLYGTTEFGGGSNNGVVFKVKTDGTGYTVLHPFTGGAMDGAVSQATPLLDGAGNLFGTTSQGGSSNKGVIYTMMADGSGYSVVHNFVGGATDGASALGSLTLDASGNLYGTTNRGGIPWDIGVAFKLKTDGTGFTLLHTFVGGGSDGVLPSAGVVLGPGAILYGTTTGGGSHNDGVVYMLKTDGTGYTILHTFVGGIADGSIPQAPLVLDPSGNLYGTTYSGGAPSNGTEFRLVLPTAVVTGGGTVCAGEMSMIGAALTGVSPWNLTWSDGAIQTAVLSSPATRSVSPTSTTIYFVTAISDADGAGTASGNAVVIVNPDTTPPSVTAPGALATTQSICL